MARAFVFAKAGLAHRAETLLEILATEASSTENVLLMKAMTLEALGQFDDRYVGHLEGTMAKNTSLRALWMKTKLLNRWGAYKETSSALKHIKEPNIFIRLVQAEALIGQQKWLAAKAHLALSEDARSSLTQVNLGRLASSRQRRHYSYESMVDTKSISITLSYHPCLLRSARYSWQYPKSHVVLPITIVKDFIETESPTISLLSRYGCLMAGIPGNNGHEKIF